MQVGVSRAMGFDLATSLQAIDQWVGDGSDEEEEEEEGRDRVNTLQATESALVSPSLPPSSTSSVKGAKGEDAKGIHRGRSSRLAMYDEADSGDDDSSGDYSDNKGDRGRQPLKQHATSLTKNSSTINITHISKPTTTAASLLPTRQPSADSEPYECDEKGQNYDRWEDEFLQSLERDLSYELNNPNNRGGGCREGRLAASSQVRDESGLDSSTTDINSASATSATSEQLFNEQGKDCHPRPLKNSPPHAVANNSNTTHTSNLPSPSSASLSLSFSTSLHPSPLYRPGSNLNSLTLSGELSPVKAPLRGKTALLAARRAQRQAVYDAKAGPS